MKKKKLIKLFDELKMHPGRQLGQNFLLDDNLLEFIVRSARPAEGEVILEAGPGFGALTEGLLDSGAQVIAVEYDVRIYDYLCRRFSERKNLRLVQGDVCRVDLEQLLDGVDDFRCVANLPYSISSLFMAIMTLLQTPPSEMVVMLQKETAQRLVAKPGCKEYGSLTVLMSTVFHSEMLRSVHPRVFYPAPEVNSAIVRFKRKNNFPPIRVRKKLETLARMVFSQRRKKMLKRVVAAHGKEKTEDAFRICGIDIDTRPERVTPEEFVHLVECLSGEALEQKDI